MNNYAGVHPACGKQRLVCAVSGRTFWCSHLFVVLVYMNLATKQCSLHNFFSSSYSTLIRYVHCIIRDVPS